MILILKWNKVNSLMKWYSSLCLDGQMGIQENYFGSGSWYNNNSILISRVCTFLNKKILIIEVTYEHNYISLLHDSTVSSAPDF